MHVAVALITRLVSAPKQQQPALVSSFTLTPETGRHYHPGGSSLAPCTASLLAVEANVPAAWTGTSISDLCRSHTPPTLALLTRISQIGCDSPALAVEAKLCYSLTASVALFGRPCFLPRSTSGSERRSLMCAAIQELARCQNKVSATLSSEHQPTAGALYVPSVSRTGIRSARRNSFAFFINLWQKAKLRPRTRGQVRREREQRMARCLLSRLFPQWSEYSCVNTF